MKISNKNFKFQSPPKLNDGEAKSEPNLLGSDSFAPGRESRQNPRSFWATVALGGLALGTLSGCGTEFSPTEYRPALQEDLIVKCDVDCLFDSSWSQDFEMAVVPDGTPVIDLLSGEHRAANEVFGIHIGKGIVVDNLSNVLFAPDMVNPGSTPTNPGLDLTAETANARNIQRNTDSPDDTYFQYEYRGRPDDFIAFVRDDVEASVRIEDDYVRIYSHENTNYGKREKDGNLIEGSTIFGGNITRESSSVMRVGEGHNLEGEIPHLHLTLNDGQLVVSRRDVGEISRLSHDPSSGEYEVVTSRALDNSVPNGNLVRLAQTIESRVQFSDGEISLTTDGQSTAYDGSWSR